MCVYGSAHELSNDIHNMDLNNQSNIYWLFSQFSLVHNLYFVMQRLSLACAVLAWTGDK